jgi:hypothetical protein
MAHATFLSDLKLLVNTVLRRWDSFTMESSLNAQELEAADRPLHNWNSVARVLSARTSIPHSANRSVLEDQVEASCLVSGFERSTADRYRMYSSG